jgi:spore coat polysaccharide biosynthesis predicted glycosyltransferase SpsG
VSASPSTDKAARLVHGRGIDWHFSASLMKNHSCAIETAGTALYERLEHWIQMNSGVCDPKDTAAIEAWKEATK